MDLEVILFSSLYFSDSPQDFYIKSLYFLIADKVINLLNVLNSHLWRR